MNISQLLNLFDVNTIGEFNRLTPGNKPVFIKRLYKILELGRQDAIKDLKITRGIKLHFYIDTDRGGSFVPNETYARKIAFFANKTLFTCRFSANGYDPSKYGRTEIDDKNLMVFGDFETSRGACGGRVDPLGKCYLVKKEKFLELLSLVISSRRFIEEGLSYIFLDFNSSDNKQTSGNVGLTPANFCTDELCFQFREDDVGKALQQIKKGSEPALYIPYFSKSESS